MTDQQLNERLARYFGGEWRSVPANVGYHVSSDGRVFSEKVQRLRKPGHTGKYFQITMSNNGERKTYRYLIHRLVAHLFIGPCPIGMEVCHKDGNPHNNHVSNLKYATRKENALHKFVHGTMPCGKDNHATKLTSESVAKIRAEYTPGVRGSGMKSLAKRYNIGMCAIRCIIHNKTWRDPAVLAAAALAVLEADNAK